MVLNRGDFTPQEDIPQHLKTFFTSHIKSRYTHENAGSRMTNLPVEEKGKTYKVGEGLRKILRSW